MARAGRLRARSVGIPAEAVPNDILAPTLARLGRHQALSIERSSNSHGRAQAQGFPRSTGRSTRASRALAPVPRGMPALPSAEAEPPRLPELRLLRRPAGARDQGPEGRPAPGPVIRGAPRIRRPARP